MDAGIAVEVEFREHDGSASEGGNEDMMKDDSTSSREALENRIDEEMSDFRSEMLEKPKEELYELAYRIYMTERIGVLLKEMLPELQEGELLCFEKLNRLIEPFYQAWTRYDDNSEEELKSFLHKAISEKTAEMEKQ